MLDQALISSQRWKDEWTDGWILFSLVLTIRLQLEIAVRRWRVEKKKTAADTHILIYCPCDTDINRSTDNKDSKGTHILYRSSR